MVATDYTTHQLIPRHALSTPFRVFHKLAYLYLPEFALVTGPFGNRPCRFLPPLRTAGGRRGDIGIVTSRRNGGCRVHDGMVWDKAAGRDSMGPFRPIALVRRRGERCQNVGEEEVMKSSWGSGDLEKGWRRSGKGSAGGTVSIECSMLGSLVVLLFCYGLTVCYSLLSDAVLIYAGVMTCCSHYSLFYIE